MKTKHLNERCQQRGITPLMLDALLNYGEETYQRDGAVRMTFTKKGFNKFEKDLHQLISKVEQMRKLFVVEKDGALLTTGYRYQHLYRG